MPLYSTDTLNIGRQWKSYNKQFLASYGSRRIVIHILKNNFGEQEPILCVPPSKIDIFLNQYHTSLLGGQSDTQAENIWPQLTLLCQIVHNKLPHMSIVQGKQKV